MEEKQYVQVQNLTDNPVVYLIPEDNLRRVFGPYETKSIEKGELDKLYYRPGGARLLQEFLSVKEEEAALEYGVSKDSFDHEYSWDEDKIEEILTKGSLDALHDALDFAPEGIVEVIVQKAVSLRIPDVNKRQLIQDCTGKNVNEMIATQIKLEQALGEENKDNQPKQRRVEDKPAANANTGRRTE